MLLSLNIELADPISVTLSLTPTVMLLLKNRSATCQARRYGLGFGRTQKHKVGRMKAKTAAMFDHSIVVRAYILDGRLSFDLG